MATKSKLKKEKSKISKRIEKSDSENDEGEHELSYYMNDRVKLMKEVLKIIKPKKIKSMAPDCIKDLDIEEINSMLLEELLGISNKRLKYIFNGQNLGEDSSSTDPEEEKPIDVISLDDVSDDEFVIDLDSDKSLKKKHMKQESKVKRIKKELDKKKQEGPLQEENLMNVLELLELQARARAIRSQLMLEANKKVEAIEIPVKENSDSDDAVIMEIPRSEEIVIESSGSDVEVVSKISNQVDTQKKKIKLIRDRCEKAKLDEILHDDNSKDVVSQLPAETPNVNIQENSPNQVEHANKESKDINVQDKETQDKAADNNYEDEIILIVDQEEMAGMIGD